MHNRQQNTKLKALNVTQQKQDVFIYFDSDKEIKEFAINDISDYNFPGVVVKLGHKKLNLQSMEILIHIMENSHSITSLKFEELLLTKGALNTFLKFLKNEHCRLETLSLISVNYDDYEDLRKILETLIKNNKIQTLQISDGKFLDSFEKTFIELMKTNRKITQLDFSMANFSGKLFSHFGTIMERNRTIKCLKLRGLLISDLESKVLQFLLGGNNYIETFDVSHSKTLDVKNLKFLENLKFSHIQHLHFENIKGCEINELLPGLGKCISQNHFIQTLNMRNNKSKTIYQQQFFEAIKPNRTLRVINMERNKITDQSIDLLANYLTLPDIQLEDLILSRNLLTSIGLSQLSRGIKLNKSIKKLYLSFNNFDETNGIVALSDALCHNDTLQELYLAHCNLKNTILQLFCECIKNNCTLQILDISQNPYTDEGLKYLGKALERNEGLIHLSVASCEEVTDQVGLSAIVNSLKVNKYLKILDFTGNKMGKPVLKQNFLPAIQQNITLHKIMGRVRAGIIDTELIDNIIIEQEIIQRLEIKNENNKHQIMLNLEDKKLDILNASMKLIRLKQIQQVNLSGVGIDDYSMTLLSTYLKENPPLEYLNLSSNPFTNEGLYTFCDALKTNKNLLRLILLSCKNLDDDGVKYLHQVIYEINMDLWEINIDMDQITAGLAVGIRHEAQLNKAIRKHLKPIVKIHRDELKTIEFQSNIKKHFESVVKCWRIMKPEFINLTGENLTDEHIKHMSEYLIDKGGVHQIQLRRNQIGDEGAKELARFIEKNDKLCVNIEMSRNLIKDEGAKAIYKALQKNSYIKTFLIEFGNEISPKILEQIDVELKANHNIEQFVTPSLQKKNEDYYGKLLIHDKGPEFLRCALKSIELFKLQELDLSDNLLGSAQVMKIAKTLMQKNVTLKKLSLQNNQIDSNGAYYLAEAIKKNYKLSSLNISYNNLGDKGIATLVLPIAKQRLNQTKSGIQSSQLMTKLRDLDVSFNNHSTEALKHVYALLFAKKDIIVHINHPKNTNLQNNQNENEKGNNSVANSPSRKVVRMSPSPSIKGNFDRKSLSNKNSISQFDLIEETKINIGRYTNLADQKVQKYLQQRRAKHKKYSQYGSHSSMLSINTGNQFQNYNNQAQNFEQQFNNSNQSNLFRNSVDINNTPFQIIANPVQSPNDLEKQEPYRLELTKNESKITMKNFLCGRACKGNKRLFISRFLEDFKENKRDATLFKCNENILTNVECISQKYVTAAIYLSIFAFYAVSIVVPLTEEQDCKNGHSTKIYFYYGAYLIVSFIMELLLSIYLYKKVGDRKVLKLNKFHMIKLITGQLARMDFFTDMLFITSLYSCGQYQMMIASIFFLAFSSAYTVFMVFRLMIKDHSNLLENIERNCKLAYISEHHSLAIILDSFSLSNFESFGKKTVTIPKIVSSIKSFTEDLPQFIIQVIYLLTYDETANQAGTIFLSIMLGAFSFAMSIQHALTAKTSNIDSDLIFEKLQERIESQHDSSFEEEEEMDNQLNDREDEQPQEAASFDYSLNQNIQKERRFSGLNQQQSKPITVVKPKKTLTMNNKKAIDNSNQGEDISQLEQTQDLLLQKTKYQGSSNTQNQIKDFSINSISDITLNIQNRNKSLDNRLNNDSILNRNNKFNTTIKIQNELNFNNFITER